MRLINADALNAEMYHKSFEVDDGRQEWNSGLWIRYKIFEEAIRDAPTVDAIPVIRCKDCKFYHKTEDDQFCGQGSVFAFDEHYCSIAERKVKDGKQI